MIPEKTRERQVIPLTFQGHTVRTVLVDGVPWFVARDVCDILEIKNPSAALGDFPENEKIILDTRGGQFRQRGGAQSLNAVNEPGLYRFIFQSRKPEAERLKTWAFNTVLPQIRQTGFFIPASSDMDERLLSLTIAHYFTSKRPDKKTELKIGKCLTRLKELKHHGEFLPCLSELGIPYKSALRLMELYRKSTELELFGQEDAAKPQPARLPAARPFPIFSAIQHWFHSFNELPLNVR